ncbi:MAG: glycosyltransferase [Desulfobacteraceae bacterium]|nr:glycosyltransferase [Desulfobacteraceae bacterium]
MDEKDRVEVIHHKINQGKGAALRTGFRYIMENHADFTGVITVDADGQHLPEDVEKIGNHLDNNPEALILGARTFKGKVPLRSAFGNEVTHWVYRLMVGEGLKDTQTGLRGIPVSFLPFLTELKSERYAFELEMLLNLHQKNIPIREIPITTVYENNNESSHFRPLADSRIIYYMLFSWYFTIQFPKLFRYSISGCFSTIVDFGVYSLLIYLSIDFATSSVIARIFSVIAHYTSNKYFTFSHRWFPDLAEVGKYLCVTLFNLSFSILLIALFVRLFDLNEILSKVFAQMLLFLATYILLSRFVFFVKNTHKDIEKE